MQSTEQDCCADARAAARGRSNSSGSKPRLEAGRTCAVVSGGSWPAIGWDGWVCRQGLQHQLLHAIAGLGSDAGAGKRCCVGVPDAGSWGYTWGIYACGVHSTGNSKGSDLLQLILDSYWFG